MSDHPFALSNAELLKKFMDACGCADNVNLQHIKEAVMARFDKVEPPCRPGQVVVAIRASRPRNGPEGPGIPDGWRFKVRQVRYRDGRWEYVFHGKQLGNKRYARYPAVDFVLTSAMGIAT